jgi:hypothetical protein
MVVRRLVTGLCAATLAMLPCLLDSADAGRKGVRSHSGKKPSYFKTFVRQHELCHHLGYRNEIDANCCAIRRMRLSSSGIAALRNYIISRDVNSQTAVDHPGQGAAFWGKTASRCLGRAHR